MEELDKIDFRNYANDILGIDTGTPSGQGEYLEWLEELICDDEKLQRIKKWIKNTNDKH